MISSLRGCFQADPEMPQRFAMSMMRIFFVYRIHCGRIHSLPFLWAPVGICLSQARRKSGLGSFLTRQMPGTLNKGACNFRWRMETFDPHRMQRRTARWAIMSCCVLYLDKESMHRRLCRTGSRVRSLRGRPGLQGELVIQRQSGIYHTVQCEYTTIRDGTWARQALPSFLIDSVFIPCLNQPHWKK